MPSVIDLTGDSNRPRRVPAPALLQPHHLFPAMPAPAPGPVFGPRAPSARLGGHRFTGSLALDILAKRRPPPRPAAPPRPLPLRPPPLAFPPRTRAPRAGGFRGRGPVGRRPAGHGRLTKNQLHGRGEHYVYKSRRRKRLFDSAGSYSAVRKRSVRKRKTVATKARRGKGASKRRGKRPAVGRVSGGRSRLRSASKLAHAGGTRHVRTSAITAANARTAAELVRLASALRQSSERRLRRSSSRIRPE